MRYTTRSAAAGLAAAIAMGTPQVMAAEPQLTVNPWFPAYGQAVQVQLRDANTYLPATRYSRSGNTITLEFESAGNTAFAARADFGSLPVTVGELAPGSYTVRGRLFDMSRTDAAPRTFEQQIEVSPPDAAGVYVVPRQPDAFQPIEVIVKPDYQMDPASLRASVSAGVVRVDYTYAGDAPVNGAPAVPGFVAVASVKVAGLSPGAYRVDAVGTDRRWSTYQRSATRNIAIGALSTIVEYYADSLDHYFISAWPDEVALLDGSPALGFKRTGQQFKGWLKAADAPQGAVPVCRFYASGPNSHFYTADPSECQFLKSLEQKQRGDAQVRGEKFGGWQFEFVAFYALAPRDGMCPGDTQPVYRDYNMRGDQNDSNHRFVVSSPLRAAMKNGWSEEGVAFCSPT